MNHTSERINSNFFCSLFGHNLIADNQKTVCCKTCHQSFDYNQKEDLSGSPRNNEFHSLFRKLILCSKKYWFNNFS